MSDEPLNLDLARAQHVVECERCDFGNPRPCAIGDLLDAVPALLNESRAHRGREAAVRALHYEADDGIDDCFHDGYVWPCPTIAILDGKGDDR